MDLYTSKKKRFGFIFRIGSAWIGVHYSYKEKRICINLLPCLTFWFIFEGGEPPHYVGLL